ncbi:hypothetical protein N7449_001893 [Penicillium cf. viridicatum]|uniref:Uncharacterized protein n=1 Tax=Penicillium cf. viridicatum TaxID=2972119 RepID=A0A9W9N7K4_9EURO|nr:hypothetical protein N7449_001893 [Penicillium cf. viridicatum]
MWAAHNNDGYDVPLRFLEASHIVQHHTQTVELSTQVLPANEFPGPKGHIWGRNLLHNLALGSNLLLVATRAKSFKFVQQLLHEGWAPREMVPMEPIRSLNRTNTENSPTIPAPKAIGSVWLIFLYGLVEGYLLAGSTDDSCIDVLTSS